jgi:hypothetical protein
MSLPTAFVINLKKRSDKRADIDNMMTNITCMDYEFVDAVERTSGTIGCALSHIKVLNLAKSKAMPAVIVMEDDNMIVDYERFNGLFPRLFSWLLDNHSRWDFFNGNPARSVIGNPKKIVWMRQELGLCKYDWGTSTNFVIYNSRIYDKFIEDKRMILTSRIDRVPIDKAINDIANKGRLTVYPFLTQHKPGFSDISQKEKNATASINESSNFIGAKLRYNHSLCGRCRNLWGSLIYKLGRLIYELGRLICKLGERLQVYY